ncbi:MAG: alpha/beta fold hydrolase [Chloroflexi bacterium]|nr:alpha/beta fold hydrolase [Chloroflexota bacterium]
MPRIRVHILLTLSLVATLALAACVGASAPTATPAPAIALTPCQLSAPGSAARFKAKCGTLTVFENRAAAAGRTINLRIAVLPAISRSPAPDPLFFLAGGPGQAATESFVELRVAFDKINRMRDIVLVDQRGTGGSNPLHCQASPDDPESLDDAALSRWLAACLQQLPGDPKLYTTSIAMDDLDAVRAALGYNQINLYGVSYGTRAALAYLRQYPQRVRAVVLDGVVPSDIALGLDAARDAQHALDLIFQRCAADSACAAAFPSLPGEFQSLLETLQANPPRVTVRHPFSGVPTTIALTRSTVAGTVRLLSYTAETAALLPLLIHNAQSRQDYTELAAQAMMLQGQLNNSLSPGMAYSVQCAEDAPFLDAAEAARANASAYLQNLLTDGLGQVCALWPRGDIPADFKQPVSSNVPVLLLSGEADPVTPPDNAAHAAATLPNSLQLVAPGQGHNVVYRGCIPKVMTAFVESGSVSGLDAACVGDLAPVPFFINYSGPKP